MIGAVESKKNAVAGPPYRKGNEGRKKLTQLKLGGEGQIWKGMIQKDKE